jgi:hypothetical protein
MRVELEILKPWWDGEKVGIAERRLVDGATMEITIAYEDVGGNRVYPYTYLMPCRKIKKYPTYMAKGTKLFIVPIKDFEVLDEDK